MIVVSKELPAGGEVYAAHGVLSLDSGAKNVETLLTIEDALYVSYPARLFITAKARADGIVSSFTVQTAFAAAKSEAIFNDVTGEVDIQTEEQIKQRLRIELSLVKEVDKESTSVVALVLLIVLVVLAVIAIVLFIVFSKKQSSAHICCKPKVSIDIKQQTPEALAKSLQPGNSRRVRLKPLLSFNFDGEKGTTKVDIIAGEFETIQYRSRSAFGDLDFSGQSSR